MGTALGDFILYVANGSQAVVPAALNDATRWPEHNNAVPSLKAFSPVPHVRLLISGDVQCLMDQGAANRGGIALTREPEQGGGAPNPADLANGSIAAWLGDASWQPTHHRGRYFFVFWDADARTVTAFTDLFRTYPLYYMKTEDGFMCASDMRLMLLAIGHKPKVNKSAIYHYLNFAYIPSPHTIIEGIAKLPPGFRLDAAGGHINSRSFAEVSFFGNANGSVRDAVGALRNTIVDTVRGYRPGDQTTWGTFLSGGADSSSISGILAQADVARRVDSFSIGFAEAGYDEMAYSRFAVEHFGLTGHELNVSEDDAVAIVPRLVKAFSEPFGNPSAIPTYYCADLARKQGKQLLIAGDGGDEIFGGNQRYAKDQIFTRYYRAPAPMRWVGSMLAAILSRFDFSIANRVRNMIRRGQMPNPDRFYSDDSFASDHFVALLTPAFREAVRVEESLDIQREIFVRGAIDSELHRLMYLDLKLTIAESDLVKVISASKLAGVDVSFPFLDRELVDYVGRFPERFKVNGFRKRVLFKLAMVGILPARIRKKKKQGFGLPVAVWLRRKGNMHALVKRVVLSEQAISRGYFNPEFVAELVERHAHNRWDHSSEIFRLLMLELWHREYLDPLAL